MGHTYVTYIILSEFFCPPNILVTFQTDFLNKIHLISFFEEPHPTADVIQVCFLVEVEGEPLVPQAVVVGQVQILSNGVPA